MKKSLKFIVPLTLVFIFNSCHFPFSLSDNRTDFPKELLGKWFSSDKSSFVVFSSVGGKLSYQSSIGEPVTAKAYYTRIQKNNKYESFVSLYAPGQGNNKYIIYQFELFGDKFICKFIDPNKVKDNENEKKFRFNLNFLITLSKDIYADEEVFYRENSNGTTTRNTGRGVLGNSIKIENNNNSNNDTRQSTLERAKAYYESEHYGKALELLNECASNGNARCQYVAAEMYRNGRGTTASNSNAFYWYKKCAENGLEDCYRPLGAMYAFGEGTKKDFKNGKYWLKKAGLRMCPVCWGKGLNECSYCEGSGRRYSWSGSDIGRCNHCSDDYPGYNDCYKCDGIGVVDPDE